MDTLPKVIIIYIFSYLNDSDVCKLLFMNKKIYDICLSSGLSKYKEIGVAPKHYDKLFKLSEIKTYRNIFLYATTLNILPRLEIFPLLSEISIHKSYINKLHNLKSSTLQILRIYNSTINEIKNLSGLTKLYSITFENCNLNIFPDILDLPKLESVYLNKNKIKYMPKITSKTLITIHIDFNNISEFPDISEAVSLETLGMTNNELSHIPKIYSDSLVSLYLQNNHIKSISDIYYMKKLSLLDLSNNHFTELCELNSMNLKVLFLDNNKLTITPNISGLEIINRISFNENEISYIKNMKSKTLKHLYLDKNKISNIKDMYLPNLKSISVTSNKLQYFSLANMHNLKKGNFMKNDMTEIFIYDYAGSATLNFGYNKFSKSEQQKIKSALKKCLIVF